MIITAKRTTKPFEMFMDEYQETQYWNSQYSQLIGYKLVGVRWQKYPDWQGNDEYSEDPYEWHGDLATEYPKEKILNEDNR